MKQQTTTEVVWMKAHPVNPVHPVNVPGVNEIIGKFGGADQLRNAVNQLQSLLYAA